MDKRSEDILLATVDEYIRTGDPISSRELYLDYDFGIRAASIRSELNALEEFGWLEQLHISGGRVPTDKALEFFVYKLRGELFTKLKLEKNIADLAELVLEGELKKFVHKLSHELHLLSAGVASDESTVHTSGLPELFNCIDPSTSRVFCEIARDVECLNERMAELLESEDDCESGPRALIGKKSPLIKNDQVTTIFDVLEIDGNRMLFATFGSRRMNYRKNFRTFLTLRNVLENYG